MFDHDEMRRHKFFEGLRFAFAFAACMAAIAAVAFGGSGCATGTDGIRIDEAVWIYVTNRVDSATGDSEKVGGASSGVAEPASSPVGGSVALDFRYGGFNGNGAKEDSRCRIGSPRITKDRIAWKWETKIPADWRRQKLDKGPMVVSAAFYWDEKEKKWIGGKMDWCDEARSSRDTAHIYGGYNGWKSTGWDSAKRRAFCVVSSDGKYRSNLIED